MSGYSEDQLQGNPRAMQEFQETFHLFDNKGDGKIAAHQLGDVLRAMNLNPTEAEVKKCGYSQDSDARISFEVFLPMFSTLSRSQEQPVLEDFVEGFRVFDKDQNGTISAAELRHLLTSLGERLTDEECELLLQGYEDAKGNVNYEEFVKAIINS